MKHMIFVQWAVWLGFIYPVCSCQPRPDLKLWYTRPAERWEETLPLGNGRLGMMPDGGVVQETIVLNDITMWSGSFQDTRNPEALKYLPEIRRLLLEGKNDEAQELMYKHFACGGQGSAFGQGANAPYGAFQLLGNLHLQYHFPDSSDVGYSAYERGLSLDKALAWKGSCIRGGGVVDASWKAGRLEKLTLHSRVKSAFKLKIPEQVKRVEVDRQQHDIQNGFIHLALDEGEQCEIVMKYKL